MSRTETYRHKTFTVIDPDARLRRADALAQFIPLSDTDANAPSGAYAKIPQGSVVTVDEVRILNTGAASSIIFAHCLNADGSAVHGWSSSRNFRGKFVNETLGAVVPPNNDKKGPNAAWADGKFVRQVTLVKIVDAKQEIEFIAERTLDPWLDLVEAAASAGIEVALNDGFRNYADQKVLYDGYKKKLPGYNQAAEPGRSKHQNGVAFDINVPGGEGNPAYDWLALNAPQRGFVRTVSKEPWHWEYDPVKAQAAIAANTFKTPNVTV